MLGAVRERRASGAREPSCGSSTLRQLHRRPGDRGHRPVSTAGRPSRRPSRRGPSSAASATARRSSATWRRSRTSALIARHGADWFRALGSPTQPGTALVTLGGAVARPGVYEIAFGTPDGRPAACRGRRTSAAEALLVGGYDGRWLGARHMQDLTPQRGRSAARRGSSGPACCGSSPRARAGSGRPRACWTTSPAQSAGQCGPCVHGLARSPSTLDLARGGTARDDHRARLMRWGERGHRPRRVRSPRRRRALPGAARSRSSRTRSTDHRRQAVRRGAPRPSLPLPSPEKAGRVSRRPTDPIDPIVLHRPRRVRRAAARAHPASTTGATRCSTQSRSGPTSLSARATRSRPPARRSRCAWRPAVSELADAPRTQPRRRASRLAGVEGNERLTSADRPCSDGPADRRGHDDSGPQRTARRAHVHRAGADRTRRAQAREHRLPLRALLHAARRAYVAEGARLILALRATRAGPGGVRRARLRVRRRAAGDRPPLRLRAEAAQGRVHRLERRASAVHFLWYLPRAGRSLRAAWRTTPARRPATAGRGVTALLAVLSLCAGLVLALALLSQIGAWHRGYGF